MIIGHLRHQPMHHAPRQHLTPYDRLTMAYRCGRMHNRRHGGLNWRDVLYSDSLATEIFLSLMLVSLGTASLWLQAPLAMVWLVTLGVLRLCAIIRQHRRARLACAVVSLFTWFCMLYYSLAIAPRFAVVFLVFALQSFWVFMRMPVEDACAHQTKSGEG